MSTLKEFFKNISPFLFKKDNLVCFLIAVSIFFLDRISKIKIIGHQIDNNQIYINDFINFDLVWNTGIGFGFLSSDSNLVYNSITAIIGTVIAYIIYLAIKSKIIEKISFSLIIGGALGNFYDRLHYFAVPDFIDVHYLNFHWFTFNLADIFISLGIIILISKELFTSNENN